MKLHSFIFFFLFTASATLADCRRDSTVLCYENLYTSAIKTITVSYFHLDSGSVDVCSKESIQQVPFGPYSCFPYFYNSESRAVNAQGLTQDVLTRNGGPSGWTNSGDIRYSYDSLGNLLNETHLAWNGTAWDTTFIKTRIYNSNNLLLEEFIRQGSGGVLNNFHRTSVTYSGNTVADKIFQRGNGALWVNDSQFVFIYTAGNLRDSLILNYWDTVSNNWLFIYKSQYKNNLIATLIQNDTLTVSGILTEDTLRYDLDTLDNLRRSTYFRPYSVNPAMGIWANRSLYIYDYFNNKLCLTRSFAGTVYKDTSYLYEATDCVWLSYHLFYDSLGRLIHRVNDARCGMPRGGQDSTAYDPDDFITYQDSAYSTMVDSYHRIREFFHADTSYIMATIPPWEMAPGFCQSNIVQINILPIGGCPPYHYTWTPNSWITSDTLPNPHITVQDTITYSIRVFDDYGHADTMIYHINPVFNPAITVDTSNYHYIAILTTEQNVNYYYSWYLNGVLIPGAHSYFYHVTTPGNYKVIVNNRNFYCTASSNTVYFPLPALYIHQQPVSHSLCIGDTTTLAISCLASQPVSCQWYKNNTAIPGDTSLNLFISSASFSDTGNYYVIARNSLDTISSDTVNIAVLSLPDTSISFTATAITSNAINVSYQWLDCQNNYLPITGEVSQSFTPTSNGNYAVMLSNNSCTDTSGCIVINTVDISEVNNQSIKIFPSPVHDILFINVLQNQSKPVYKLFDSIGQIQISGILIPGMNTIQMKDLADGIYFLFCREKKFKIIKLEKL